MATLPSNHFLAERNKGNFDAINDQCIGILMQSGFVFDPDVHAIYTDVSANELPTGNGYTQKSLVLTTPSVSEDDTNNRSDITFDNATVTASGGSIGPCPGMTIIDDTHINDMIVGYIDFGSDQTANDGAPFTVANIIVRSQG